MIHRNLGLDDMVCSIEIGVPRLTVRPRYDWYTRSYVYRDIGYIGRWDGWDL